MQRLTDITDSEVDDLTRSERPWNIARRIFERHSALISKLREESFEEASSDIERAIRRAEFGAVEAIGRALGIMVADLGSSAPNANPDPEGLKKWLGSGSAGSGGSGGGTGGNAGSSAGPIASASRGGAGNASRGGYREGSRAASGLPSTGPAGKLPLGPENVVADPSRRPPGPSE